MATQNQSASAGSANGGSLEQRTGNDGTDFGGDPGDSAYVMNRKIARLAGSPTAVVDRDFQRLQRQTPRTPFQNTPSRTSVSGILLSAARGRAQAKGRKKNF